MNRQFHAKIQLQSWLLLAAFLFLTGYAAWVKHPVFLCIGLLLMVVLIDRMIHTTYTVTSDSLLLHTSRYVRDVAVPLSSIQRIDQIRTMRLFGKALSSYLLVTYADEQGETRQLSLMPKDDDEFVQYIQKKRQQLVS